MCHRYFLLGAAGFEIASRLEGVEVSTNKPLGRGMLLPTQLH